MQMSMTLLGNKLPVWCVRDVRNDRDVLCTSVSHVKRMINFFDPIIVGRLRDRFYEARFIKLFRFISFLWRPVDRQSSTCFFRIRRFMTWMLSKILNVDHDARWESVRTVFYDVSCDLSVSIKTPSQACKLKKKEEGFKYCFRHLPNQLIVKEHDTPRFYIIGDVRKLSRIPSFHVDVSVLRRVLNRNSAATGLERGNNTLQRRLIAVPQNIHLTRVVHIQKTGQLTSLLRSVFKLSFVFHCETCVTRDILQLATSERCSRQFQNTPEHSHSGSDSLKIKTPFVSSKR